MNCNEEFVVKAIGKLTLEFNFDWEQQRKINEILHLSLYEYEVFTREKGLVASDLEEKIMLYLQVKKLEHYSESTLRNYFYILRRFEGFMKKPVATISKNDIRFFLANCYPNHKASSVNSVIFCLKAFFQWLADEEMIPKNPARLIKETKLPKRLRKSLTAHEIERLRVACKDTRDRALLEFLFATGCRVAEVVNVNISDLNFNNNSLIVIGKGDKQRTVYFSDKTKLYLENYLNERKDNNPALFIAERKPFNRVGPRGIEGIIAKIGIRAKFTKDIYPHLLRHSMATLGLRAGADISTIQHLLGHTSPATTETYAEQSDINLQHEYNQHFIQ